MSTTPEEIKARMKRAAKSQVLVTTLKKFSRLAEQKAQELCHHLWTSSNISSSSSSTSTTNIDEETSKQLKDALQRAVCAMVNSLLYRHIDLLYTRHLTVIVIGIVCCTAKICGFKVKFPAVMKVAVTYFDYEDADALGEVSLDGLMSMKVAKKLKEKEEKKKSGGGGSGGSESSDGWGSSSSSDDEDDGDEYLFECDSDDDSNGAVGSAKEVRHFKSLFFSKQRSPPGYFFVSLEFYIYFFSPYFSKYLQFYNKVMVPLVTLYINDEDGSAPDLLGSTQDAVSEALDNAGVEIKLDACKLYAAKGGSGAGGGGGGGSSSQYTTTNAATTLRNQSQSQATPPAKLLGVSGGGDGGGRSKAKKPGSRTPLAALAQKKKKSSN
jgi:hypothetical protein